MPLTTQPAAVFPLYLIPSNPFRRRPSTATTATTPAPSSTSTSPPNYLSGSTALLRCSRCLTHLCPITSIISKGFTGRHGRAYLVSPPTHSWGLITPPDADTPRHHQAGNLPNTHVHRPTPRLLVTGAHTVCDISCIPCGAVLGWKYVDAEEEDQKYKVGMFILETKRVVRSMDWEGGDAAVPAGIPTAGTTKATERKDSGVDLGNDEYATQEEEPIEFDSQDEDECEDLFMGIWSSDLAKRRRKAKMWRDERDIV